MQAVILAAGTSSRFYPFTHHKSLTRLMGKTLIEHTILSIRKSGIKDIVIVVGRNNVFEKILDPKELGVKIRFIEQAEPLGMGNALLCARVILEEHFFLVNSYRLNFHEYKDQMLKISDGKDLTLLATPEDSLVEFGVLKMDGDKVVGIVEKPKKGEEPSNLRIVGIYFLNSKFISFLENTETEQYQFEKALSLFVEKNPANVVISKTTPFSLKYAWELLDVKDYLFSNFSDFKISKSAQIGKNVVISGDVYIGENARIFEGACIKGPAFIGDEAIIGNSSLVRNGTVIEKYATIGAFTEIKNSIIFENSSVHSGVVEDSIIGKNCRMGAKFCTANRRIDRGEITAVVKNSNIETGRDFLGSIIGDDVRIGVNVSTMPGVIVGNNVTIGPSTTIMENVEKDSLIYSTFKDIKKRKNS